MHWCPDHQEEKKQRIANAIAEAHKRLERDYQAMPLPATRMCMNPNPTKHKVRAVFASGKFYRRSTPQGGQALDSRCKECRKEESKVRRESLPDHVRKARHNASSKRNKRKRQQGREEFLNEKDRRLDSAPFIEWLNEHTKHLGPVEVARRSGLEASSIANVLKQPGVQLSTVDKVGIALGYSDLVRSLYPPDDD
jgi:hypothetical protein